MLRISGALLCLGVVSGLYLSPTFGYEQGFDVYRSLIDEPAAALVDAGLEALGPRAGRPRFLFLHFFNAHWPYLPDDRYLEQVGERPREISDLLKNVIERRPPKNAQEIEDTKVLYDAELAQIDEELGRFFAELESRGLFEDALVVVTSDHGEGFYEHDLWQHSEIIYREVTRIPMIVKPPGARSAQRVEGLVSQLGVFPTFLEAASLESPFEHSDFISLSEGGAPFPDVALTEIIWEANQERGPFVKIAAESDGLKYVATYAGDLGDEQFVSRVVSEELYDLEKDPLETNNVFQEESARADELRYHARAYLDFVVASRGTSGGESINVDEELAEKLKALGYIQ